MVATVLFCFGMVRVMFSAYNSSSTRTTRYTFGIDESVSVGSRSVLPTARVCSFVGVLAIERDSIPCLPYLLA